MINKADDEEYPSDYDHDRHTFKFNIETTTAESVADELEDYRTTDIDEDTTTVTIKSTTTDDDDVEYSDDSEDGHYHDHTSKKHTLSSSSSSTKHPISESSTTERQTTTTHRIWTFSYNEKYFTTTVDPKIVAAYLAKTSKIKYFINIYFFMYLRSRSTLSKNLHYYSYNWHD